MDPEQLVIKQVAVQHFKSVQGAASIEFRRSQGRLIALVGVNGAASHLRIQHFRDLAAGSQLPNVAVLWKSCAGKELKLQTSLNKDRERVFRLNGKIVTKAVVTRTLLKERLYGDFTFIRQAQVGKIVQSSGSSKALASIISEVSGGSCQRQAAQQANSSLTTFQTQLTHVRQSIAVLQSNIQSDDKAVAVEQERAASTRDCNACAQTLLEASSTFQKLLEDHVGMLGADIAAQERLVADMGTEGSNVSEDESRALKTAKGDLASTLQQLEEAQGAAMLAGEEASQAESVQKALEKARVASSAHAQDLVSARAARATQEVLLNAVKSALASGQKLNAVQQFRKEISTTENETERLQGVIHVSLYAVKEEEHVQSSLKRQLEKQVLDTADHRNSMQHMRTAKRAADTTVAIATAAHCTAERRAHAEHEKLLTWCPQVTSADARPLLASFTFKPPCIETVRRCQLALSLLLAPTQDVLLLPCMADVSRVLKANNGRQNLRFWPLDSISYTDRSSLLSRICKEWPQGALVNPVDLCDFEASVAPAMYRVFGTGLIAVSDQVASQVLAKHGISCITQGGTRHSRGSLEGGWRAPGSTASTCSYKLAAQQASAAAAEAEQHLQHSRESQAAATERLRACEETEQAQTDLHQQVEASEARERVHKQQLKQCEASLAAAKKKASDLRGLIAGTSHAVPGQSADLKDTGLDTAQLKRAAKVAEKRVRELHAEVAEAERASEMLQEQDSELEQRLEGLDVDMLQDTREEATKRLEECEVAAADCRMHVKVAEGACERAAAEQKLLGEKIQEAKKGTVILHQEYQQTCREQQSVQESYDVAASHLDEHGYRKAPVPENNKKRDQSLQTGGAGTYAAQATAASDAHMPQIHEQEASEHTLIDVDDARSEHNRALDSFRKAEKHLRVCNKKLATAEGSKAKGGSKVGAVERHAADTRREALKRTQVHMHMLEEASQVLKEDVETSAAYSMALGRAVFDRTARMFKQSMASAIPQLQFDTCMCGATLDNGVEIIFRESSGTKRPEPSIQTTGDGHGTDESDSEQRQLVTQAGNSGNCMPATDEDAVDLNQKRGSKHRSAEWSSNLGELSEGQRSICALVFVMSASASGVKPAVLLVDEVDAALDGVNQSLAGQLLAQAAAALHCQVWAVSHSDAFHACCDTFLKVSKGSEGTSVEVVEATSYRGSVGAKRASAGPSNGAQRASTGMLRASPGAGKRGGSAQGVSGSMGGESAAKRKVARHR